MVFTVCQVRTIYPKTIFINFLSYCGNQEVGGTFGAYTTSSWSLVFSALCQHLLQMHAVVALCCPACP